MFVIVWKADKLFIGEVFVLLSIRKPSKNILYLMFSSRFLFDIRRCGMSLIYFIIACFFYCGWKKALILFAHFNVNKNIIVSRLLYRLDHSCSCLKFFHYSFLGPLLLAVRWMQSFHIVTHTYHIFFYQLRSYLYDTIWIIKRHIKGIINNTYLIEEYS